MAIDAIYYFIGIVHSRKTILDSAPTSIISKPRRRLTYDQDGRISKKGYSLWLLEKFQDGLRRRDVYVTESDRWSDPRPELLTPSQWQSNRLQICRSLGHPPTATPALAGLSQQLESAYQMAATNFASNDAVNVDYSGKRPSLTIANIDEAYLT